MGTVVEDQQLLMLPGKAVHGAGTVGEALPLMPTGGDGEMLRQDGVGVDERDEVLTQRQPALLLRSVVGTEEAGAPGNGLRVYLSPRGDHPARVALRAELSEAACPYIII